MSTPLSPLPSGRDNRDTYSCVLMQPTRRFWRLPLVLAGPLSEKRFRYSGCRAGASLFSCTKTRASSSHLFSTQVRQQIRTAERFGYEVSIGDSCDELKRAWPLVEMTARLKGFRIYRPLSNVLRAFELGRRHNCVRICTASLRGRPIQTVLLVRDGVRADYIYGGLDRQALGHSPSPGCLLHWFGIREALRLGCTYYDLGDPGDEKMRIFKSNFRPTEYIWPAPLTLITNRALFPIWEKVILGSVGLLWPWIKMATARLLG